MKQKMKRCAAAFAAALCVTAAGCGKQQAAIDPADALEQLKSSTTFTDQMTDMDSAGACRFYDVSADLVQDGAAYVGSGATAESMAVFEATDTDAAQGIADALQTFTDSWIKGYSDYKPEEVPKLESAVLEQDGVYVVFCVTADNAAAKTAVQDLLHP